MKNYVAGFTSKCLKAFVIGSCFMVIIAGAAFAQSEEPNQSITQSDDGYGSKALQQKHQVIDKFVFEQHKGDFSDKGFKVTNTGPVNGVIEIGITPYDESNAQYLYGIFGKDMVKVVEGQQAVTLALPAASKETAADKAVGTTANHESAAPSNSSSNLFLAGSILAGFIILGGAAVVMRRNLQPIKK